MRALFLFLLFVCGGMPLNYAITFNINTAIREELELLDKIGKTKAEAIIHYRETHGSFPNIAALKKVKGIGEKIFLLNQHKITVTGPTVLEEKHQPRPARSDKKQKRRAEKIYPAASFRSQPEKSAGSVICT